jgi:hypothetical protein
MAVAIPFGLTIMAWGMWFDCMCRLTRIYLMLAL